MTRKDFAVGVACGLTLGIVAGALAGLLFAPASGAETRRRLRYEREQAAETARLRMRRTMALVQLATPAPEKREDEDAFSGA